MAFNDSTETKIPLTYCFRNNFWLRNFTTITENSELYFKLLLSRKKRKKGRYLKQSCVKNKTNHLTSSNSHLRRLQIKQSSAWNKGWGLQNQQEHLIILTKYEHPTTVSENYNDSSSGKLTVLIKVQTVSILSNMFAGKFIQIISKRKK